MSVLICRYAQNAKYVEIDGKPSAWRRFCEVLSSETAPIEFELYVPKISAKPYDGFLKQILISNSDEMIFIERKPNVLHIAGSLVYRRILADVMNDQARTWERDKQRGARYQLTIPHTHIESSEVNYDLLLPNSMGLVINAGKSYWK